MTEWVGDSNFTAAASPVLGDHRFVGKSPAGSR
jgi:hypothetical protein